MNIPTLHRPLYDGCTTGEEKAAAMTAAMTELQEVNDDGMDFSNKTSMAIAYERHVESQRDDRLFHDPLAVHLYEPYGQKMSDALAFGLAYSIFDPPGADIGIGMMGHTLYTAARTKFINTHLESWLGTATTGDKQVVNLGAGADTRVFWLDCLEGASIYWEVDQASVMTWKQTILNGLDEKELVKPKCTYKCISMDFNKESVADLPKHGFDSKIPTCWILEGLIMYLPRTETEQLFDYISQLSAPGSYLILNFASSDKLGPTIDEIDERLTASSWTKESRLMFGEEGFNFGRYPSDKPANKLMGFGLYQKK
ncbi:Putative S-adenosyl-L-methionine-dependent methyltransferase [Seminavis robusta]|uniref:S-adenosyl-L-methionine-dependent methyltransferase n=1 Tax=Seminavis robusta TaxID=568900 RepID=A0A9N8HA58_9STRA|nr:Putative S-adenosyl-L-methionine-dependent methyltransferase [Seminavis robusta]|eukprot:Sro137_g064450.1 Putative S-adenosyl-L-methionine-dependent methyltransferase (312) ;mRNA; r:75674-76609